MGKTKIAAIALTIVLALIGGWNVSRGAYTLYRDYQDFKMIRAWVIQVQQAQQKQQAQKPPAHQGQPTP